jgi:hypothetical protein
MTGNTDSYDNELTVVMIKAVQTAIINHGTFILRAFLGALPYIDLLMD